MKARDMMAKELNAHQHPQEKVLIIPQEGNN